jgi:hypothetical protein
VASRPRGFYKKYGRTHPIMGRGSGRRSHALNLGKPHPTSFSGPKEKKEVDWQTVMDRIDYYVWNESDDPIKTLEDAAKNIDHWLKEDEYLSEEDREELKKHLPDTGEKNNKSEHNTNSHDGKVDVEYFLKHAKTDDINSFLSAHPEYLGLYTSLRQKGWVENAKAEGKPIHISPSRVILNKNRGR